MDREDLNRRLVELRPELAPELNRIAKIVATIFENADILDQPVYTSAVLRAIAPAAETCVFTLGAARAASAIQTVVDSVAPEGLGTVPSVTTERLHHLGHELARGSSIRRMSHRVVLYKKLGYTGNEATSAFQIPPLPALCLDLKAEASRARRTRAKSPATSDSPPPGAGSQSPLDPGSSPPKSRASQLEQSMQAARGESSVDFDLRANLSNRAS